MNVNPFSYLTNAINTVIQTNDNIVNLSSKTAKQLIDDVYASGAKVRYLSATGGQKLSDLPIIQAGTYVVYAFTYYKAIHFIGTDGRSLYFNYGDNTWKQIALTSDLKTYSKEIRLAGATWSQSASGIYYISSANAYAVPGATEILSLTIEGWDSLRTTDVITPYISGGTKISLMSNVNSFASVDYSMVKIKALYK